MPEEKQRKLDQEPDTHSILPFWKKVRIGFLIRNTREASPSERNRYQLRKDRKNEQGFSEASAILQVQHLPDGLISIQMFQVLCISIYYWKD